jgi:hypothetical protein
VCPSFVLDGEAVIFGDNGLANFNALHARQHDGEARFIGGIMEDAGMPPLTRKRVSERPDGWHIHFGSAKGALPLATTPPRRLIRRWS